MSPIDTIGISTDNSWQAFVCPPNWNSIMLQARAAIDFYISGTPEGTSYWTVKSGRQFVIDSFDMSGDTIYIKAANGNVIEAVGKVGV